MSEDGQGLAFVVFFLQSAEELLAGGMIPQEEDGRFGQGPREMGMANFTP
jgi:hypothetical protein